MHFTGYLRCPALLFALVVLAMLTAGETSAQENAFVPVGDWTYTYIERLQRRGHLLDLNPTALPYTRGAVRSALGDVDRRRTSRSERRWVDLLRSEFQPESRRGRGDRRKARLGVAFDVGLRTLNAQRLDVLRPEAATDPTLKAGSFSLYPNTSLRGYLERGGAIAHAGGRFDVYYRDHPDGLDAANRLITRTDESYIGYDSRFASIYLGRIGRHWSPRSDAALLLSDNAVGMDQIAFRFGGNRLSWQGMLGELDSATPDGRFTGTAGADTVGGSIRRYLAIHRVDWRPSRHLGFSIMEAALYSGLNAGPSIKFLNPLLLHLFEVDGRPKNDENNGLVAALMWAHFDRWTLSGQLMIDDIDILSETGEPASASLTGSLTYAGLSHADVAVSATAVTSRAYNTHQAEGRYIYLNHGLAVPFNDFVHISASAPLFLDGLVDGLSVTPTIDMLLQGERDIREAYPTEEVAAILDGTVERTIRPGLEMRLQRDRNWWFRIDLGPNIVSNSGHVEGMNRTRWTVLAEFGARIRLDRRLDLSF